MGTPPFSMKSFPRLPRLASLFVVAFLAAHAAFDPVSWKLGGLRGVVVGPASDQHPFQSEGTTVKLKDDTLLHAFNLRFGEKDMSNWHPHYARTVIAKVLSRDSGKTWSEPEVMFESNTGINASHPAIRRLPNGELGATYQRINTKPVEQWDRQNWIRSVLNADKIFRYSGDDGKTWSKEIPISPQPRSTGCAPPLHPDGHPPPHPRPEHPGLHSRATRPAPRCVPTTGRHAAFRAQPGGPGCRAFTRNGCAFLQLRPRIAGYPAQPALDPVPECRSQCHHGHAGVDARRRGTTRSSPSIRTRASTATPWATATKATAAPSPA